MDKHADGDVVAAAIADAAADCGISLVASLPDGWITGLIERFEADARFRHVPVNREESAIGLCSGAFFSGIGALALMGASGFLTCIYAITKINYTYQIPLLIGIALRGRPGDRAKFHQSNGLYLEPVMRAIDIPFVAIERGGAISNAPLAGQSSMRHCLEADRRPAEQPCLHQERRIGHASHHVQVSPDRLRQTPRHARRSGP